MVWVGHSAGENRVFYSMAEPDGRPVMAPMMVSTRDSGDYDIEETPDILWTGRDWAVFWTGCYGCDMRDSVHLVSSRVQASGDWAEERGLYSLDIPSHYLGHRSYLEVAWTGSLFGIVYSTDAPENPVMMTVDGDGSLMLAGPIEIGNEDTIREDLYYEDLVWMDGMFATVRVWDDPYTDGDERLNLELRNTYDLGVEWEAGVDVGDWIHGPALAWTGSELGMAWTRGDDGDYFVYFALYGFCL
jgi:hypothetical protein